MAFIRLYYRSLVTSPATPAVTPPVTLPEDELEESSPSSTQVNLLPYSSHTSHHHYTNNLSFTHSFNHRPTSAPTLGLISPDEPHPHPPNPPPSDQDNVNFVMVIFAAIGGVLGLIFLTLCARQAIAYYRLPRHNAPLTTVEREQLEREMAEYAETANRRGRPSLSAPPPPYERAPSYESSCAPHRSF